MMYIPLGTRVIGDWGAMSADDHGEVIGMDKDKGYLIRWDNSPNELTEGYYSVKLYQPTSGSPICVYVDPEDKLATVALEYDGSAVSVHFNENGAMFTLEPTTYRDEVIAYCCARRLTPPAPNQCWLLKEFFPLFARRHIVSAVMNGPNMVVEECDESEVGEAVLCNIRHPKFNDEGYSHFGDFCRNRLGQQCQYGSRYIDGRIEGYPALGDGLRFKGDPSDYHFVRIHRDDMDEFERRYKEYCASQMMGN